MGADCLIPMVDRPRTRPDGTPYTIDDKEYWLREKDGGIRRNDLTYMPYPAMLYRGFLNEKGKIDVERKIVQNKAEHDEAVGWSEHAADAKAVFERGQELTENAAAEVAYAVQRMSERAKAEYAKASTDSPEHVTDIAPRKKPGRKPKVPVTE